MKAEFSKESYALVEKLAYKFAYSNSSYSYEEYLNAGIEGLVKAINTFNEDIDAAFETYATTCIRNAMCTAQKVMKRFDLQQDENVVLDGNGERNTKNDDEDGGSTCGMFNIMADEESQINVTDALKVVVRKANKDNERNAQIALLHFGLVDDEDEPMDYKEISAKFNVSAERARQVCVATINTIKADESAKELLYGFVG